VKRIPASSFAALLWWRALCVLSLNICLWLTIWYFNGGTDRTLQSRSPFPCLRVRVRLPFPVSRVDLERLVLIDSSLEHFLGRCAAPSQRFVGLQLGLLVHQLGVHAGLWVQHGLGYHACTIVAQAFCWHSILT
jgi:hypothetical protein